MGPIERMAKKDIVVKVIRYVWLELLCINGKNPVLQGKTGLVQSFFQDVENIYPVKYRLYEMEERLNGRSFARISSSELVNTKMITAMDFSLTGTIRVTLKGGITTYVSRRRVSEIKKLFDI